MIYLSCWEELREVSQNTGKEENNRSTKQKKVEV